MMSASRFASSRPAFHKLPTRPHDASIRQSRPRRSACRARYSIALPASAVEARAGFRTALGGSSQGQFLARPAESLWPQISVSKVAVCHVSAAPDFERQFGARTTTLDRFGMDGSPLAGRQTSRGGSFLTPAPALGVRAPSTIRPGHRQVDETLETKAARQASFDCRLDDLRREESERQGHPDRTHSLALSRSNRTPKPGGDRTEVRSGDSLPRASATRVSTSAAGTRRIDPGLLFSPCRTCPRPFEARSPDAADDLCGIWSSGQATGYSYRLSYK